MSGHGRLSALACRILFVLAFGSLPVAASAMDGRLGFGLVRLDPIGKDSEVHSGPGWGAGLQLTALLPGMPRTVAGVAGFEYVNLSFRYTRLSGISTDPISPPSLRVVGPDVTDPGQSVSQTEVGEHRAAFGYDVVLGVDINPWNTLSFDAGARFVKSFGAPRQLAYGTSRMRPSYLEGYLAVAASLDWLGRLARD